MVPTVLMVHSADGAPGWTRGTSRKRTTGSKGRGSVRGGGETEASSDEGERGRSEQCCEAIGGGDAGPKAGRWADRRGQPAGSPASCRHRC